MHPAIIIGLDCLPGLQASRILAQHGVPIIGFARSRNHFCCYTNTCQKLYVTNIQTEEYIRLLITLKSEFPVKPVLFPCTDMSVFLLSQNRELLEDSYHIILPSKEIVNILLHKTNFSEFAIKSGIPIPKTYIITSQKDLDNSMGKLKFPIVIKPDIRTPLWTSHNKEKVYKLKSGEELLAKYQEIFPWTKKYIIQEWIPGPESNLFSFNCYLDKNSNPTGTFVSRKIRQWPPETGVISLGVAEKNQTVEHLALSVLQSAKFHGLGFVEIKYDQIKKQYFVIEANIGRPTVITLAEQMGIEIVYSMYCEAVGLSLPKNKSQQTKNKLKWFNIHHDARSSWYYYRRKKLTLYEWFTSMRGKRIHSVFSWYDPLPFFMETYQAILRQLIKQFPKNS